MFESREQVKEKVDWEGGLLAAMDLGITEDEMPDPELREAWRKMRLCYLLGSDLCEDINRLIGRAPEVPPTRTRLLATEGQ